MRIAVFGTGGVGGYFGGRLAEAGEDVIFISRGPHLKALREHGLCVESTKGNFSLPLVQATDDPRDVNDIDIIMLCVKCWQVPEAIEGIRPLVGSNTCILPMENGVDTPGQLAAEFGWKHVIGGVCGIVSFIAKPGLIRHIAYEPFVTFGEWDNRPSDRVNKLSQAFQRCSGLIVNTPPDIQAAMWSKYILIASWSGIGAVSRVPIGVIRNQPGTRALLRATMEEIKNVARAQRINLSEDIVDKTLAILDSVEYDGTASMQRDMMEGRYSELEAQTGALVRMGKEVGVLTPINNMIYYCLRPMELCHRGQVSLNE